MNVDDKEILDRIERLAREAGAREQTVEQVKPEPVPEVVVLCARYLTAMADTSSGMADSDSYWTFTDGTILTYGQIRSLKLWLEKQ